MKIERLERHWPGANSLLEFGAHLNVVLVRDPDRVAGVFDAAIAALSGPGKRHNPLRRAPAAQRADEIEIDLGVIRCDGRRIRILREMTRGLGQFKMLDADSGERLLALDRDGRSDLLSSLGRDRFEALARIGQTDLWAVASMGMGLEQTFRRNTASAGATVAMNSAAGRARAALGGELSAGAELPGSPVIWARAREVDLGRRISEARRLHSEAASARAALRRLRATQAEADSRFVQAQYFALISQQSTLLAKVARLRSLEEEVRRLTPAPLPHAAADALAIAPEADRLLARIGQLERAATDAAKNVPEPSPSILEIESRLEALEAQLDQE